MGALKGRRLSRAVLTRCLADMPICVAYQLKRPLLQQREELLAGCATAKEELLDWYAMLATKTCVHRQACSSWLAWNPAIMSQVIADHYSLCTKGNRVVYKRQPMQGGKYPQPG